MNDMQGSLHLGERIRLWRVGKGLTLAALSERTGLSISFLSQLERDQAVPSVNALSLVAEALGVNLVDLFASSPRAGVRVVPADRRLLLTSDEAQGARYEFLTDGQPTPVVPCLATLQPGGRTSDRPARHRGFEFAYVLEGTVTYWIGDEAYILKEGDGILFDAAGTHRCTNDGDRPCTWLWISIDAPAS